LISIKIDVESSIPIFQQIVSEIERNVLLGTIKAEDFIPSVREFSLKHSINPNTVAKAYAVLQDKGIVEFVRGTGLRVNKQNPRDLRARREHLLQDKVERLVEEAEALGFDDSAIIGAIKKNRLNQRKHK
jgi:GntR family transcriptional regulator